jgi:hypothetical protein
VALAPVGRNLKAVGGSETPCSRGYYGSGGALCTLCPPGTTTSLLAGAAALRSCDTCRPGFGAAGGKISAAEPACGMCTSGTYSAGNTPGGQACAACPKAASFSGKMVSRRVSEPEPLFAWRRGA